MPLFGSNFAEGFATGFATETSKAINKAVDRRDEEVSKAKAFAMKRAEQLDAEATAKDARTEKAIDKMAAKFTKGGKTDWNRVYSAMMSVDGADLDSLDALFENIQKTEASGQAFNIDDVFKYAEGDSELSKLSKDDIFQALRAEYAAPTVQTSDTGLLSKIGLGAGTTGGERATEEMQGLFPGATRTAITGDYGTTTVDQKPLAAAIEYGMKIAEYEKNMSPSLAEAYASTAAKIGKLDMNSPTYTQDLEELKKEQDRNVSNIAAYTKATTEETTAKGSMTASGFAKVITDGEASALALSGINEKLGIYTDSNGEVQRDGLVNPQGIASAKKRALEGYYEKHVRGQMDGNGQLSFLGQQVIMNRPELKAIYDRITGSETTTTTTTGTDDTTKSKRERDISEGPEIYGTKVLKALKDRASKSGGATPTVEQLYDQLLKAYPETTVRSARRSIHRERIAKIAKDIFAKPVPVTKPDVDEARASLSQEKTETRKFTPEIEKTIAALETVSVLQGRLAQTKAVMKATDTNKEEAEALIKDASEAQAKQKAAEQASKPASELSPVDAANRVRNNLSGSKEDYDKAIDDYVTATNVSRERATEMFKYKGQTS